MIDPNSPDPSKRKSFFEEDEHEHIDEKDVHPPRPTQSPYNGRERMASGYYEDEEEEVYHDDEYDRRKKTSLPFMQNLTGGGGDNSRRLMYAAGGVGGLLVLFVGGWMVFNSSNKGIPVIDQPTMPAKEKAANAEGMQTIGMGVVGGALTDASGQATLAPAPEKANPTALAEQYNKPPPPPPVVPNNEGKAGGNGAQSVPDVAPLSDGEGKERPSHTAKANETREKSEEAPVVKKHHTQPKHKPVEHQESKKQVVKKEPKKEPVKEVKKEPKRIATTGGGQYAVQLAALGSNSGAEKHWQVLRKKAPEILGGHSPTIQKAEVKGNTIYRLRVKGFASKSQANAFCNQLKAKSISCTYGNF